MSKNVIYEKVGMRVKEARKKSGLTQEDLAEKVGVSATYISSIERGLSFPRGEVLVGILNALNVSSDLVFCDVVGASLKQRSCLLYDMIQCLPSREQVKILEVVELLTRQFFNALEVFVMRKTGTIIYTKKEGAFDVVS